MDLSDMGYVTFSFITTKTQRHKGFFVSLCLGGELRVGRFYHRSCSTFHASAQAFLRARTAGTVGIEPIARSAVLCHHRICSTRPGRTDLSLFSASKKHLRSQ